jgi:NADPH:quinone reductase-like Zn-dependent oxidoreductase
MVGRFMDGVLLKAINTVLGVDIAGRVEVVGAAVKQFQPGDEVFGVCKGAFAEYACADENELVLKPASLSLEAACAGSVAHLFKNDAEKPCSDGLGRAVLAPFA